MILSSDSTLQSPVLEPKTMGLMILHQCLAQLPGCDPSVYTSTYFPVDLILNLKDNTFCPKWQEIIAKHLCCCIYTLGADQGLDPAAVEYTALHIPDNLEGFVLQTAAPQNLELLSKIL